MRSDMVWQAGRGEFGLGSDLVRRGWLVKAGRGTIGSGKVSRVLAGAGMDCLGWIGCGSARSGEAGVGWSSHVLFRFVMTGRDEAGVWRGWRGKLSSVKSRSGKVRQGSCYSVLVWRGWYGTERPGVVSYVGF